MEADKRNLVIEFAADQIDVEAFVKSFGVDPRREHGIVGQGLERALAEKSSADVEVFMILAYRFGLSRRWASILSSLLGQTWHMMHEDIASALQDIRDPATVEALFEAAHSKHEYLAYDEHPALAVKCIWALHDIGTDTAIDRLQMLAQSGNVVIRDEASERLVSLFARKPDDPEPPYRKARDANVRD